MEYDSSSLLTFKVLVSSTQNHPKNPKSSKLHQTDSCHLAEIHPRQAVHHKNPEMGYRLASPGGTRLHRQAVPPGNQKHAQKWYKPPGGYV